MSLSPPKYTLVFDLFTVTELLESLNEEHIQLLASKSIDIGNLKTDTFVEKIRTSGELFCEEDSRDHIPVFTASEEAMKMKALKEAYEEPLGATKSTETDNAYNDYRFSKIDFLMFSGTNKNQLVSKTLGFGVIRLFIKQDESFSEYDEEASCDGTVLAILAVPSYFSIPDLFGFLGEEGRDKVTHFRIFRSENPSRFMVIMKFRTQEDAVDFQKNNNGREFSSLEPETCQVINVERILFRPSRLSAPMAISHSDASSSLHSIEFGSSSQQTVDQHLELPTCPICLERMDTSLTGLVTSSCAHTFHCMCLWKWKGGTCPVCRATSLEERKRQTGRRCSICSTTNNLWACLICGNIACGRYDSAHAIHHFKSTNHCYAIDLGSQSVWDYAEDRYVHRLIRNEADGKIVELPSREDQSRKLLRAGNQNNNENDDTHNNSIGKNDNEALITALLNIIQNGNEEYSEVKDAHILKQQELMERIEELEKANEDKVSQKSIEELKYRHNIEIQRLQNSIKDIKGSRINEYEENIETVTASFRSENKSLQDKLISNNNLIDKLNQKVKSLEEEVANGVRKTASKTAKQIKDLQDKNEKFKKELEEEREFSKAISDQLEYSKTQLKNLTNENEKLKESIKEKEEETRDLMFYIESLQKFENDPELKNSDIVVKQKPSVSRKHRK